MPLCCAAARASAGGLDDASYGSWPAALVDLSLRLAGMGWRNALCETGFVARIAEAAQDDGDGAALAARWPAWHARIGAFLMEDPLRPLREELQRGLQGAAEVAAAARGQGRLFG